MSPPHSFVNDLVKKGYLADQPLIENAMRKVSIDNFIPKNVRRINFGKPIPFVPDRTISAPNVIVSLLSILKIGPGHKVLIFGSKSGYIASLISEIVETQPVYILENDNQIAQLTKKNIENAGYSKKVFVVNRDPLNGFAEKGPWDKILVTGAIPRLPEQILDQLNDKGMLAAPIGSNEQQQLFEIYKDGDNIIPLSHGDFIFGPLNSDNLQKQIVLTEILDRKEVKKLVKEEQNLSQKCPLTSVSCNFKIIPEDKEFFVAHSYVPDVTDDLREAIKQAVPDGFEPYYASEGLHQGTIFCKICGKIQSSRFGIYEISQEDCDSCNIPVRANPNVTLELGLAYGFRKPALLVCKKGSKVSSDLAGLDRIEYKSYKDLTSQLKKKISSFIQ